MRKIILSLTIFIVLNINADMTFFATKAKLWNISTDMEKFVYVAGLMDGAMLGGMKVQGITISTKLDTEQYVKAIDEFYKDYRNINIPVAFILKVIAFELDGASDNTIKEIVLKLRNQNN